jgi:hypothetical protein
MLAHPEGLFSCPGLLEPGPVGPDQGKYILILPVKIPGLGGVDAHGLLQLGNLAALIPVEDSGLAALGVFHCVHLFFTPCIHALY